MASWTTIPDSSLEPGKPIRSIDMIALRDNLEAVLEFAPGAPPIRRWFAYNYESAGNGLIYDSATDGTVAAINTPDFDSDFDYLLVAKDLNDTTSSTSNLWIQLFTNYDNTYRNVTWKVLDAGADAVFDGSAILVLPRESAYAKSVLFSGQCRLTGLTMVPDAPAINRLVAPTKHQILRARIVSGSVSIAAGKVYLYKRHKTHEDAL
jgi:hypothetical protein